MIRHALSLIVALASTGCLFSGGSVTRVYAGREVEGPYVTPEAYAHYTEGRLRELGGDDAGAISEYLAALDEDPDSLDAWVRLGAVSCRAMQDAKMAFREAESIDAEFEPLWRERARCALSSGDAARALSLAEHAVALDPDDDDASLVAADALTKLGRREDARRWLVALIARSASARGKQALAKLETGASTAPNPNQPVPAHGARPPASRSELDRALIEEPDKAKALARRAGVTPGELAVRAAALGLTSFARAASEQILSADPDDGDAWVAGLCAASLEHDQGRFERVAAGLGEEPLELSPLAVRLMTELILRKLGPEAASAWQTAWALPAPSDPLERAVETRIGARGP